MRSLHLSVAGLDIGLRWSARLLAAALVGLIVVMFMGEGGFNPLKLKPIEAIQMTLFFTACAGLVVGWRTPLVGGAISAGAMLLFLTVEFTVTRRFPPQLIFHLMLLAGILFLSSALVKRRMFAG